MTVSIREAARLLPAVLVLFLTACYQLPPREGGSVDVITVGDIETVSPVDIAVAPLIDLTEVLPTHIPEEDLRTAFARALVKRRYTPLHLDYVDRHVVDAAYAPGAAGEDAVLVISVEEWDDSLWDIHYALNVTLEAVVIDPDAPSGAELWKARVSRRFDKNDFGEPTLQPTEIQRLQHA